jgi:Na+/H+ antiporter NhaC
VLISLFGGIVLGALILSDFSIVDSLVYVYEIFKQTLSKAWVLKTLAFAVLVGSVMSLIEKSGGIGGFVDFMQHRLKLVKSERSALFLSYIVGVIIFVESSITSLIAGAVGRPFCKEYNIPQAKLAFVCDSTSAPVSSILIFNGWGALLLGLVSTQISSGIIDADPINILTHAVFYNFYAFVALIVTFVAIYFKIDIGAMKHAKYDPNFSDSSTCRESKSMYYMLIPIFLMVILVFLFLYITGDGEIFKGSGSSSIFYTMLSVVAFSFVYYIGTANMSVKTWAKSASAGAIKLTPIASILLFAFVIGQVTSELKTGQYLASLATDTLSPHLLAGLIFLLSSLIAFSTGTSWGTFSIMIPIATPMAVSMGVDIPLLIGAVISGGIFGDHCSPISDTTIISSMASDCELVEHVKTQLPYALISGVVAFVLFVISSYLV